MRRDPVLESDFLATAGAAAGGDVESWHGHVIARLEAWSREGGATWAERGATAPIAAATEEAADLGGCAVLAVQALETEVVPETDSQLIEMLLALAATRGAQAHAQLAAALALLDGGGER